MVQRIAVVCGSARTAPTTWYFRVKYAPDGRPGLARRVDILREPPVRGLRAMGWIYAGWALSQAFYREELHRTIGFSSLEDF
jgi:homoserine O-acetyltransferase